MHQNTIHPLFVYNLKSRRIHSQLFKGLCTLHDKMRILVIIVLKFDHHLWYSVSVRYCLWNNLMINKMTIIITNNKTAFSLQLYLFFFCLVLCVSLSFHLLYQLWHEQSKCKQIRFTFIFLYYIQLFVCMMSHIHCIFFNVCVLCNN